MTDLLPSAAADIERMEGELQALSAELAARNSEFGERIEYQAATIEVLKAMSASPGDAQPVFDLIARQAAKLCNVPTAAVATFDGTMLHLAHRAGSMPHMPTPTCRSFPGRWGWTPRWAAQS